MGKEEIRKRESERGKEKAVKLKPLQLDNLLFSYFIFLISYFLPQGLAGLALKKQDR